MASSKSGVETLKLHEDEMNPEVGSTVAALVYCSNIPTFIPELC
jgi:hypothetical protein